MAAPRTVHRAGGRDIGRKRRGDFPTPPALIAAVLDGVVPSVEPGQRVRVVDPACGDGRFLIAAADRLAAAGAAVELCGVELDPTNAAEAAAGIAASVGRLRDGGATIDGAVAQGDALDHDWSVGTFDLVVGNPPYLSQLSSVTTRGGSSSRGGGPYADVAAEFLALAVQLARPGGGRVGLVLPQSILASRDAGPIRAAVDREAESIWSWWSPRRHFDASVVVCALGFERRLRPLDGNSAGGSGDRARVWTDTICRELGVPALPPLGTAGTLADRARLSADFRDCYYGLVPAVGDHSTGPRFVTSGLIDPATCRWGSRAVRFAGRRFERPRVDVGALDDSMRAWAAAMSGPKVLVANQSSVIECVADADGSMLPGVPIVTVRPSSADADAVWEVAAVLTSPAASVWAWRAAAGTGLSARTLRLGPRLLADVPWPAAPLGAAVAALRAGDVVGCGSAVDTAFGLPQGPSSERRLEWWSARLP